MLKYVKGDLIKMVMNGEFDIIIHGANIHNAMASGIAGTIRRELPAMVNIDSATTAGDIRKLGHFTIAQLVDFEVKTGNPYIDRPFGVNLYTQATIGGGPDGNRDNVDYDALERGLYALNLMFCNYDVKPKIGIPKIGAGLGGGDWKRIEAIINSIGFSDITCVEFDQWATN